MTATLTSKERVLRTFAYQAADRVPINYSSNPGIDQRLKAHFGLQPDDGDGLLRQLGVDFRGHLGALSRPAITRRSARDVGGYRVGHPPTLGRT